MMAIIFTILLISVLVAWGGKRTASISLFAISFVLSIFVFIHHLTSSIGLSL